MQLSTKRGLSKTESLIIQEKHSPYKMKRCDTNHLWFSLVQEYVLIWCIDILKYVDFCFCQKKAKPQSAGILQTLNIRSRVVLIKGGTEH